MGTAADLDSPPPGFMPGDVGSGKNGRFTLADVKTTYKRRDAWWTIFLVDPVAARLVVPIVNYTSISPNQITIVSLLVGIGSAASFFWLNTWPALIIGAALYHLSFTLDCMDGKVARVKGTGTISGGLMDWIFDRIRTGFAVIGLFGGQYRATGEARYLYLGILVCFFDGLRYMDAQMVNKVRSEMRARILSQRRRTLRNLDLLQQLEDDHLDEVSGVAVGQAIAAARDDAQRSHDRMATLGQQADAEAQREEDDLVAGPLTVGQAGDFERSPTSRVRINYELQTEFNERFPWYLRFRDVLLRHRVRTHLISGIEFQMLVFIVGPACNMMLQAIVVVAMFELVIHFKLYLSTRDCLRLTSEAREEADRLEAQIVELTPPDQMVIDPMTGLLRPIAFVPSAVVPV
jgi:phosphatidylglycerophosphate synthase